MSLHVCLLLLSLLNPNNSQNQLLNQPHRTSKYSSIFRQSTQSIAFFSWIHNKHSVLKCPGNAECSKKAQVSDSYQPAHLWLHSYSEGPVAKLTSLCLRVSTGDTEFLSLSTWQAQRRRHTQKAITCICLPRQERLSKWGVLTGGSCLFTHFLTLSILGTWDILWDFNWFGGISQKDLGPTVK